MARQMLPEPAMYLFVDTDCLRTPFDAVDDGRGGLAGFEAVLHGWPQARLVLTTERRHWTTLERLRDEFSLRLRPRVVGTTRFHGALAGSPRPPRERDVEHWLRATGADDADWLALDDRPDDYDRHPQRHLHCRRFAAADADALQQRLLQRARLQDAVQRALRPSGSGARLGT